MWKGRCQRMHCHKDADKVYTSQDIDCSCSCMYNLQNPQFLYINVIRDVDFGAVMCPELI